MISPYLLHILILFCVLGILALGFAVSVGGAGLINLSFIALMAIGAYVSTLGVLQYDLPVVVGMIIAAITSGIVSGVLSIAARRLKGEILVVLTLTFHIAIFTVLLNWSNVTRGALGIPGIPRPMFFSDQQSYLALALLLLGVTYLILHALMRSPFGRVLGAVRDDEVAAQVLGKDAARGKRITYVVTGAVAGLSGALYAHYLQFIDPKSFHLDQIVFLLTVIILGGLGSLEGALAGTAVAVFVPELLRFTPIPLSLLGPLREIIFGTVVILILIYRPRGIMGKVLLK